MNRDVRSTVPALLSAGLLTLGATGCFGQETVAAEPQSTQGQSADDSAEGVTETLSGEVAYLAPGEYIVNDQAFYVAEDTQILAGIHTCPAEDGADDNGSGTVECSFDEFDAALQEGTVVLAEVEVVEGVAATITEYEA